MPVKTILITGAAGFIGTHLARHVLATEPDARLLLVDNFERGVHDDDLGRLIGERAELVAVDCTSRLFGTYVDMADEIYHLAAVNGTETFYERPVEVMRTNTLSLITLIDRLIGRVRFERSERIARPAPRLLFTSSNEAYAGLEAVNALPLPTPEAVPLVIADPYNPRWSYAASKLLGEMLVIHAARQHQIPALIVRPHNFYGPRAGTGHVIPQMLHRVFSRVDPFPITGYDETRSFCYIDDAVDAMARAMTRAADTCPTFHIGSNLETPISELADAIFATCRWRPKAIDRLPSPAGSVKRRLPDVGKISAATGWTATTPLADGLAKTAAWYVSR